MWTQKLIFLYKMWTQKLKLKFNYSSSLAAGEKVQSFNLKTTFQND